MDLENKFKVGDLVTLKSHPLFEVYEIKGDGKYVPPIMIVKEVLFEDRKKKTHDEITGYEIAERIKYICTYFDDNKSEFIEAHIYQSMLDGIKEIKIGRFDDPKSTSVSRTNLVDEVLRYALKPEYSYSGVYYFKTKKLEVLKKRSSVVVTVVQKSGDDRKPDDNDNDQDDTKGYTRKTTIQYIVNYATPEFVACGFKSESYADLFYNDGKMKRLASTDFVKVKWYNPIQQKFSDQYLPMEFFTDINPFGIVDSSM